MSQKILFFILCLFFNFLQSKSNVISENKITKKEVNLRSENDKELKVFGNENNQNLESSQKKLPKKRKWCILVYIAADNELHYFAWNNIKQLANGANDDVNILVQLNEPGKNKKTQLYLIEKNKAVLLNKENQQKLDSGDPQTLIDFCLFSIKNYPAENYILVLSNHGSGVIDRYAERLINPSEFFLLNPSSLMLELDRSIEFLNFLEKPKYTNYDSKGLCFDETFQSYFSNQKLEYALRTICNEAKKILNEKEFKFAIIGMDACLMQMIEIVDLLKGFASILVASQEVELGPGWRYDKVLNIFKNDLTNFINFAKHIVKVYEDTYLGITNDFTLSAINIDQIDELTTNINKVAELLIELLQKQKDNSARNVIKKAKTNVGFEEPSYIDITSFYNNILKNINSIDLNDPAYNFLKDNLKFNLENGIKILEKITIANVSGSNIKYAKGLSIYFPEKRIHNSYRKTNFAQTNQWFNLLMHYITL